MAPISLNGCCVVPSEQEFSVVDLNSFSVEQRPGGALLKLNSFAETYHVDLSSGEYLDESSQFERAEYANQIAQVVGASAANFLGAVEVDQWSVIPSVSRYAPFDLYAIDDSVKSHIYISKASGELVQQASFTERSWGWVGAVVHWIYPTVIRSNAKVWSQLVIGLSIVSLFMVIVGALLGVARLRVRGNWGRSRYRGRYLWHHYTGLVAGGLMLTWLFSGLMSMYPWGVLEGRSFAQEVQNLRGYDFTFNDQVRDVLRGLDQFAIPEDSVELRGYFVAGHFHLVSTNRFGESQLVSRFAVENAKEKFPTAKQLAYQMRPAVEPVSVELLNRSDNFYYDHHLSRRFPVYRILYADGERFYLDAVTHELIEAYDSDRRLARWLFHALHRGDFIPELRVGPAWYLFWGGLLTVLGFAVGLGCWLAIRRWQKLLTTS